ncbi:hypothetical protein BKA67DRAFT_664752 [Truncatella angustata]|uniref:Uncharacterized protein n=1 Tax=Truncatella angustata TaxID=152316 RepID=A0A9P8RLV6_9PEZI|nr:uncharacterized protein BKA67DRAFT_664752 [Truncatella angustata]KAH6645735.1 hypothetical protein BKA67DRAFT_664752 [Truncatella angustata]
MDEHVYNKQQKDKARKRGASLKSKSLELGEHCDIFTAVAYWDPTHKRMEAVMYVPSGQKAPDLTKIFEDLECDDYKQTVWKKRSGPSRHQRVTKKQRLNDKLPIDQGARDGNQPRRISERLKAKDCTTGINGEADLMQGVRKAALQQDHSGGLQDCEFEVVGPGEAIKSRNEVIQPFQIDHLSWPMINGSLMGQKVVAHRTAASTRRLVQKVIKLLEGLVPRPEEVVV